MSKISIDNPFFNFMGRLADIVLLNLLFLVCSVPVVTIGASLSAVYQCFQDMAEGEFVSAFRNFFSAWRKYLKESTKIWMVFLPTGALLVFDLMVLGAIGSRGGWKFVGIGTGCLLVLWEMTFCYIFPLLLKEKGSLKELIKRSMYLAVCNFQYTFVMVILNCIPAVCFVLGGGVLISVIPIYLLFGFALTAFVDTFFLRKCI